MTDAALAILVVLITAAAVAWSVICERVLPRRSARRLADSICAELQLRRTTSTVEDTRLRGRFAGRDVEVRVAPPGSAIILVPLAERAVPRELRIYATSSWSYQKQENRLLGLTMDTGDAAFDRWFDAYGDTPDAALQLPERVRHVLVEHHHRGIMLVEGTVVLGSSGATPFGYFTDRTDRLDAVIELLRAATALAFDLERATVGSGTTT